MHRRLLITDHGSGEIEDLRHDRAVIVERHRKRAVAGKPRSFLLLWLSTSASAFFGEETDVPVRDAIPCPIKERLIFGKRFAA
jgi:hypothetical protein